MTPYQLFKKNKPGSKVTQMLKKSIDNSFFSAEGSISITSSSPGFGAGREETGRDYLQRQVDEWLQVVDAAYG